MTPATGEATGGYHRPVKRQLSAEMRELLAALRSKSQGELPGLELGSTVRFIGGRWWKVEGAARCWQTETVLALVRRGLIERVSPRTYRARRSS